MLLLNAFSANMLADLPLSVCFDEITVAYALDCFQEHGLESAVGHADTANVFATTLGIGVPCNRATVSLKSGDRAILGQYIGPRLPEGATSLPDGATIKWILVSVEKHPY